MKNDANVLELHRFSLQPCLQSTNIKDIMVRSKKARAISYQPRQATFRQFPPREPKNVYSIRGVINGKAGKAAALSKFSDTLTLSQPRGVDYAHPLALLAYKNSLITPLSMRQKH